MSAAHAGWGRTSVAERSGILLIPYAFLATAAALERTAQATRDGPCEADLVPLSSHELLRLLRALILPPPRRDRDYLLWWSTWRRHHQHRAHLCHRRWHAYADTTP
ncbi:hypothetical protein ACWEQ7_30420 [Streptomyces sp. NPDC004069]